MRIAQRFYSLNHERGIVNMTQKVTLPREVAEAIEGLRRLGKDNRWIIEAANGITNGTYSMKIRAFAYKDGGNFDKILTALVNGYEIEKSPEEKVREYYDATLESMAVSDTISEHHESYGITLGIRKTLDLLGIQIEGVNA